MKKLLIIGALLLGACSSPPPSSEEAAPTVTDTTVEPTTTTLRLDGNPNPQKVGTAFRYQYGFQKADMTYFSITVRRPITCGLKGYALPPDDALGEPAKNIYAPKGHRWCDVQLSIKNVGKRVASFDPGGFIYDEADRQFEWDAPATAQAFGIGTEFGTANIELSPGESGRTGVVFPLPIGAAPTYIELADGGITETIDGSRRDVRINVASADLRWQNPRGK